TDAEKPGWRLIAALSLAGVRGAITLAGVMTLPLLMPDGSAFPARELSIFLATGVIILSLTAASIALPRLFAGLEFPAESSAAVEVEQARAAAARAAIRSIEQTLQRLPADPTDAELRTAAATRLLDLYRQRIDGPDRSNKTAATLRRGDQIERELRLTALGAEREAIFRLARARTISDETWRRLVRDLDLQEERFR
ncbi:MAG: Na+/H+ antiporter, partial [Burkholderiales bacterium]|nr:Na+/H+ antiporter [Burkholderiales bacterium]